MLTDGDAVVQNSTCIDNRGQLLLVEYSSTYCCWEGLPFGQRAAYRSLVSAGRGRIRAALAQHEDVPVIDGTRVLRFQEMNWDEESGQVRYGPVQSGAEWVGWVEGLFGP